LSFCLFANAGCVSVRADRWQAYDLGDGYEVDCFIRLTKDEGPDHAKWTYSVEEAAKGAVVESMREKGISIDACDVVSFTGTRGGVAVGFVAGSAGFVARAKAMKDGFWEYADLQHRKPFLTGKLSVPGI